MKWFFCILLHLLAFTLFAQNQWSAIMTQGSAGQSYNSFYTKEAVDEYITSQVKKNYLPTEVVYGDGKWYVVTTYDPKSATVTWKQETSFPADWVRTEWGKGKHITKVTYGDGKWFVIMTTNSNFKLQSWASRDSWEGIKEFTKDKWKENTRYNISDLAYGSGNWVVVLSVMQEYEHQKFTDSEEFPTKWIQEQYNEQYNITTIEHDGKKWYVVMTKQASQKGEIAFNPESAFPTSKIQEQWDKSRRISSLLYIGQKEDEEALFAKYVKAGNDFLDKKYYYTAIENFEKALNYNTFDDVVWNNLAWARYLTGNCTKALEEVELSLLIESSHFNNHTKAAILACQKKYKEALPFYDEAIRIYKQKIGEFTDGEYYADRAKAKSNLRDYKGAKEDWQMAIAIEPNNITFKNALIELYELMEK